MFLPPVPSFVAKTLTGGKTHVTISCISALSTIGLLDPGIMKISTRGRYGTRLMVELARAGGDKPLPLSQIARSQGISVKYLEQLIIPLKKAGFIRSVRGAKGGYVLNRPAQEISMAKILDVLENGLFIVRCVDAPEECDRSETCLTRDLWIFLQDAFYKRLESLTLEDVVTGVKEA